MSRNSRLSIPEILTIIMIVNLPIFGHYHGCLSSNVNNVALYPNNGCLSPKFWTLSRVPFP